MTWTRDEHSAANHSCQSNSSNAHDTGLSVTHSWEVAEREDAQKTGFPTGTVPDDNQLSASDAISIVSFRGLQTDGPSW